MLFSKTGLAAGKLTALKHFVAWVLGDGQKMAPDLDYAALPQTIIDKALAAVTA